VRAWTNQVITIPVAVNNAFFRWQVELWWWNHQATYGAAAARKAFLILIDRNHRHETCGSLAWLPFGLPYALCTGVWIAPVNKHAVRDLPLNIQIGLRQIIGRFADHEVIEIIDADLFHFRPHPPVHIRDDAIFVCDLYEDWHLKSLSTNKHVIAPYFENGGRYYNGGFVPIIGKAGTLRAILYEWEAVHRDILARPYAESIHWWAGMFALQAACEKARVTMIAKDWCFVPGINRLADSHYIGHYSCDRDCFSKHRFPNIDVKRFPSNIFYRRVSAWLAASGYRPG
jgi:hypothetical protein